MQNTTIRICLLAFSAAFYSQIAIAQIIPDQTLGRESSIVTPINVESDRIDGGAIRGTNLFHSFREFNIRDGTAAYFNSSPGIENIFARITGSNLSQILGTLGVVGDANLLLMNPNGILFGENSRLDIRGSFVATTASSINFADGTQFSAPNHNTPLLTVSVPVGLQFGGTPGTIINQSVLLDSDQLPLGLQVLEEQTLALIGGEISLQGGFLTALGGRIELGSVGGNSVVKLIPIQNGFTFGYDGVSRFENMNFSGSAYVDVSSDSAGDIQLLGRRLNFIEGSQIVAATFGTEVGGSLVIKATESIDLIGTSPDGTLLSGIFAFVGEEADATGVNVLIETNQLTLQEGAQISTSTVGAGNAGNLTVRANKIEIIGTSIDGFPSVLATTVESETATGNGGNLILESQFLRVQEGGQILTATSGAGDAGNLRIRADKIEILGTAADSLFPSLLSTQAGINATGNAGHLLIETQEMSVRSGARVQTTTFSSGNAGSLTVRASELIELVGTTPDQRVSSLFAGTEVESSGNSGNLLVETAKLSVRDGAQIATITFGEGDAGSLTVRASDSVELIGTNADQRFPSGLLASAEIGSQGAGGDLTIETPRLIIRDGAEAIASTLSIGDAGNVRVFASEFIELSGRTPLFPGGVLSVSGLSTRLSPEELSAVTGQGGNVTVVTPYLIIRDGATVAVSADGSGDAGTLSISANRIELNNQGTIIAETATGTGGNIQVRSPDLVLLRRESQISTSAGSAGGAGSGGNLDISTDVLVGLENSNISANAFEGEGGVIQISTQAIFGLQPRSRLELQNLLNTDDLSTFDPRQLPSSDITAISQTNPQLSGQVTINRPDVDPSQGLVNLPEGVIDVDGLIMAGCIGADQESEFSYVGRGGLPPTPEEVLSSDALAIALIQPARRVTQRQPHRILSDRTSTNSLVEAQGWAIAPDGKVILTSESSTLTSRPSALIPPRCSQS